MSSVKITNWCDQFEKRHKAQKRKVTLIPLEQGEIKNLLDVLNQKSEIERLDLMRIY